ncbi:hypothetical protein JX265_009015 [Neoarthrinium moseri]|uniref:Prolyl 4-hydroxylase alpha subunit domain-containing protein n=1 Tax=Neoarthrinium moseri TaxID=1658444 RepID=A0A9P9WH58_9PEZI|nr:uncharacterized protein JN550_007885 [Neoarthrinium moseri]KAI1862969.1 hypothetical protein JX265_009015 [Neoarthrinium moseri]KAI1866196.1 hypothetical protein JN550_007885 [Neoarthrinium moseri]
MKKSSQVAVVITALLAVLLLVALSTSVSLPAATRFLASFDLRWPFQERFECLSLSYTTEIISLDPLLIYIHGFLSPQEIAGILAAGEDRFEPSTVYRNGELIQNPYRTSSSAGLPDDDPAVSCILGRARKFLGTTLDPVADEMGIPQLVRYTQGQHYDLHRDWLRVPQQAFDGSARVFNRPASFFAILQDNCTDGETWFPFVEPVRPRDRGELWRRHEEGGLAFKPVAGNALFWVNLFANNTGDDRTVHAGLPVTGGLKTALNIWPRKYWDSIDPE